MVDLHKKEHSFGAFTLGVAVGVGAALLFGTEDGRKLAQKVFDNLPEKIKNLKDQSDTPTQSISPDFPETTPHNYLANTAPPQFS